jgi:hypothetical protein
VSNTRRREHLFNFSFRERINIPVVYLLFFNFQELFIQNLAMISLEISEDKQCVEYKDLAEVVNTEDVLQFLQGNNVS